MNSQSVSRPGTRRQKAAVIGAAAWIVNAVQFLAVQLIVASHWRTPYGWRGNNISDLGNVHCGMWDDSRPRYVCSPLHGLMNASFAAQGVLLLAGTLLTAVHWGRGRVSWSARILFAVSSGAWILVGLAPADVHEDLHVLGALLIMGVGNIGLLLAGCTPRGSLFGRLRAAAFGIGALAVAAAGMFFTRHDPGLGLGSLERVAAFGPQLWTLVVALAVLRAHASRRRRRPNRVGQEMAGEHVMTS
ncbi:DUF998 domain-containing protein [Streptomyces botrytidirepellens]|uniref:DUF998 domain-containing protein n=1 Tax=Streptomyces botrytidirepellens TaxID=2486417 RepID=UPI001609C451|nr:DUF998 domain-containing protein [Streptomyces botrytidirepellens]